MNICPHQEQPIHRLARNMTCLVIKGTQEGNKQVEREIEKMNTEGNETHFVS